jgi:ABC-type phosphate transport system substrate-binding protein
MKKIALTLLLICTLGMGVAVPAQAATTRAAKKVAKRAIRQQTGAAAYVNCYRSYGQHFECDWHGWTIRDQATGNTAGTRGVVYVDYYGKRKRVRVF